MKNRALFILIFVALGFGLSFMLMTRTEQRTKMMMGTYVKVTLTGQHFCDFNRAFNSIFSSIERIDAIASFYNKNSELSALNLNGHNEFVQVSDDLWSMIKDSIALSEASDGYFDITVAPIVELWNQYKAKGSIPSEKEIRSAIECVGYKKLALDEAKKSVHFTKQGMAIDLSAIAKGYAVDTAISEIMKFNFKSAIVDAGGDLYCLGKKNPLNMWRVGIVNPRAKDKFTKILDIRDGAAATSGGYEQRFVYKDKEYTHLINPKTGYPIESIFSSVTVLAPNCAIADGIATAVSVGGEGVIADIKKDYAGVNIIVEH